MGLLGTVSAVGTALGPSLGGALIAAFGWPAVFAVLAVIGMIALLIGRALFPPDAQAALKLPRFDLIGMALLALSPLAFSASLTLGSRLPGSVVAVVAVVSILGCGAFVRHEARVPAPLVRMDLLCHRATSAGLLSMALVSAILASHRVEDEVLMPL